MRIVFLFLILMIVNTSCDPPIVDKSPYLPDKQSLVNDVRLQTAYQLKREKNLIPFGTGAQMMYQIEMLALAFQYYQEIDMEEARELLMYAGNLLVNTVNSNKLIHPYLSNYPFNLKNVEIIIFIKKPNGREGDIGKLEVITMINGILKYETQNGHKCERVYKETYEEALAKLNHVNRALM